MTNRRLGFVIHDLNNWGGHDRSTMEIARRLSHQFPVDVYSYTLNDPAGIQSWGDLAAYKIRPNFKGPALFRFTWFYLATLPFFFLKPLLNKSPRPLLHATGACSLVSDVVQVQFVNAAWEKKRKNLPREVYSAPFTEKVGLRSKLRTIYYSFLLFYNMWVERRVYSKRKTYIAISHSVAAELMEFFGIRDRVHVIHHGVDSEIFKPSDENTQVDRARVRAEHGIEPHEVVGIFVGAYDRKGLAVVVDSIARLSSSAKKNFKLLAVGDGAVTQFRKRAESLKILDRVKLVGHTKDIARYYRAADFFVLPTLYEPFGLVILEAMATALTPVVSRLAGGSELIENGKNGLLIEDPTSPDELASLIEKLVQDELGRKKMGNAARETALKRSWDQVADDYAKVIAPLLHESKEVLKN